MCYPNPDHVLTMIAPSIYFLSASVEFCEDAVSCSSYNKSLIVCGRWNMSSMEHVVQCSNTENLTRFSAISCCAAVPLLDACCAIIQDYQNEVVTVELTYGFETQ